jgi:hypothetical protein
MATETADEALERVIRRVLSGHRGIGIIQRALAEHRARAPFGAADMPAAEQYMRLNPGCDWEAAERYALASRPGAAPERYAKEEFATGPQPRRYGDPIVTAGGRKTPVTATGGTAEGEYFHPLSDYEARGLLAAAAKAPQGASWANTLVSVVTGVLGDQSLRRHAEAEVGPYAEQMSTRERTVAMQASKSYSPWCVSCISGVVAALNDDRDLLAQVRRAAG